MAKDYKKSDDSYREKLKEYSEAKKEADQWRENYREYERLANNAIRDNLEDNLPEVNDGSLAAALFKLPKRVVPDKLIGRARALDQDDAWVTELANVQWESNIVPNANTQAPFMRKWKHAVRASAVYGSVPIVTLFNQRGKYTGADFIVAYPHDVTLEQGKVSDFDSDVMYWDMYFSKRQIKQQIKLYKEEEKAAKEEGRESYNTWDVKALQRLLDEAVEEKRDDQPQQEEKFGTQSGGIKLTGIFERGRDTTFCIYHKSLNLKVREWTNPDPTGDLPIHYLYCYQDFVNPYGIGIVKLAGGTQNVLDYFRQADVLATQLGLEPPIEVKGNADTVDLDSLVYARNQIWFTGAGNAQVTRQELSNNVYAQLPTRMGMYKTSLNQLIPVGDTSIGAQSGDPNYSKTPAGVKFQAANLSIDDEDFKNNLNDTYSAVARSMINTHFHNMQGSDLMELNDEQKERLVKSGLPNELLAVNQAGESTNELQIFWDDARAEFEFEVEPDAQKATDEQARLESNMKLLELTMQRPDIEQRLEMSGKRLNLAELFEETIGLLSDNDKIIVDIDPEDQALNSNPNVTTDEAQKIETLMQGFGVDEQTAMAMLEAERQGFTSKEILEYVQNQGGAVNG